MTAEEIQARGVRNEKGCLIWQGSVNAKGYGKVKVAGRWKTAHRLLYELAVRPLERWEVAHHRCHNKPCIELEHLQAMRGTAHTSLHAPGPQMCPHGIRGVSACMDCERGYRKAYRDRKRAAGISLSQRNRANRRAQGLCCNCPQPAVKWDRCLAHVEQHKEQARARYARIGWMQYQAKAGPPKTRRGRPRKYGVDLTSSSPGFPG